MADLWGVLGALAAVAMPMLLAGWLLDRPARAAARRDEPHGKPHGKITVDDGR